MTNLGVGDLDVVLGTTVRVHQVEETVLDVKELEFLPPDVGDVHVVGGGRNVFKLLAGEDLITFAVSIQARLRCEQIPAQ